MRIIRLCIGAALAMLLVAAGFAHANEDQVGTTAANFLTLGSGARILSMGGATLGFGDDLAGGAWNPAALGWLRQGEIVVSHSGLGDGTLQEWAAVGGRWGASTRWSLSGLYQGEGSFEGRDASNVSTGSFNVSSFALGVHLARQFGERFTVGAGAKGVSENLGTVSGLGATFDLGAMYRSGPLGLGIAAQNLGGQMKYDGAVYKFPGSIGAGASYAVPNTGLRLALDANFPQSYYNDVRFGAEYLWRDMVAVRAGYRHEMSDVDDPLSGPTFGMGAGRNGFWLDYGYLVPSMGEAQHRLSFRIVPGSFGGGGSPFGQTETPSIAPAPKAKPAAPRATPKVTSVESKPAPAVRASEPATTAGRTSAKTEPAAVAPAPKAVAPASTPAEPKAVVPAPKPAEKSAAPAPTPADKVADAVRRTPPKPVAAPPPAPAKTEPAKTEPVKTEPVKTEPVKTEPVKMEPVKVETPKAEPVKTAPAKAEPAKAEARPAKVKVKNGETLYSIAKRYGLTPAAIMMENNMVSEQVKAGQTLKLPPVR